MKWFGTIFIALVVVTVVSAQDLTPMPGGKSGDGVTTRYWDCCAPSCAWDQIIKTKNGIPVQTCQADGVTPSTKENNGHSGCEVGGNAYTCVNQSPKTINDTLSYVFVAASFEGGADYDDCCICLVMDFKGELAGKRMLAQVTNTGAELNQNHFDILIPGGGVGYFTLGCQTQFNAPENGWGERYGGVQTIEGCNDLPELLQEGCRWRFNWMNGVSNPDVSFYQIKCPDYFVGVSKCGDL
ncbi:endoglucanase-like [Diorhabda carinulata]|uniref:endoglucanase-like n=1 Tax=Diorhabda carinulata TaxID=1163345 RepID=UPI0025A10FC2|nr:endoglucanase-like [Diorhabda carinulata]